MQSITLQKIKQLLQEKKFNIDLEKFMEFMKLVKNNYIYPDAMERFTSDNIVEIYKVLEYLSDKRILQQYVEVYCPNCSRYVGRKYKTLSEIPEEIYCPHCDQEIGDVAQNLFIIYRVKE